MVEKINYYLAHPEERNKIAERGHQKFKQCYTWLARAKEFSERMHLEAPGKN